MALHGYTIAYMYKSTAAHGNVDEMSRIPVQESPQVIPLPTEMILLMEELSAIPITGERIKVWTI